jgi:hypothetical protein
MYIHLLGFRLVLGHVSCAAITIYSEELISDCTLIIFSDYEINKQSGPRILRVNVAAS